MNKRDIATNSEPYKVCCQFHEYIAIFIALVTWHANGQLSRDSQSKNFSTNKLSLFLQSSKYLYFFNNTNTWIAFFISFNNTLLKEIAKLSLNRGWTTTVRFHQRANLEIVCKFWQDLFSSATSIKIFLRINSFQIPSPEACQSKFLIFAYLI